MRAPVGRPSFVLAAMIAIAGCTERPAPLERLEIGAGDGPVLVLLHGYGSRPEHLASFGERTDLPRGTRVVLPYAPERTRATDAADGFVWWRFPGDLAALPGASIPEMASARERVRGLLDDVVARLGVPSDRVVLAGFSQGAMLALDVALHDSRPLAGIALMSGSLVDEREWGPRFASRRGLAAYVSHGRADPVLPYSNAERLVERMREGGLEVRFTTFEGAHVVTPEVSTELAAFVREVAGD